MALKHTLEAVLLAAGFSLFGCGAGESENEEQCRRYQTVLEENFTSRNEWMRDETRRVCPGCGDNYNCNCSSLCPYGYLPRFDSCYSIACQEPAEEGQVLSRITNNLYKTFSVTPGLRIDRAILQGNAYGRDISLEVEVEDLEPLTLENIGEENDCNYLIIKNFSDEERGFTRDGTFYFRINLLRCSEAPEMPPCNYTCECEEKRDGRCLDATRMMQAAGEHASAGCYGLSKIMFQQCAER